MRFSLAHGIVAALAVLLLLAVRRINYQSTTIIHNEAILGDLHSKLDNSNHLHEMLKAEVSRLQRVADAAAAQKPKASVVEGAAIRSVVCPPAQVAATPAAVITPGSEKATEAMPANADHVLLSAHRKWDWKEIVRELMAPFPHIEKEQLKTAVRLNSAHLLHVSVGVCAHAVGICAHVAVGTCSMLRLSVPQVGACYDNGTMYCQRMQIYKGSLYLTDYRAIFFDR